MAFETRWEREAAEQEKGQVMKITAAEAKEMTRKSKPNLLDIAYSNIIEAAKKGDSYVCLKNEWTYMAQVDAEAYKEACEVLKADGFRIATYKNIEGTRSTEISW